MKKFIIITSLVLSILVLQGCSFKEKLYILNWQEYISEDLIDAFEDEYDVKVVSKNLTSNEQMYATLASNSDSYDIVFPSDYMIQKLSDEELIYKLDNEKLPNLETLEYTSGLDYLIENSGYEDYFIPYFWGSLGIMYSTKNNTNAKEAVETLGWNVFFDETSLSTFKIGMYDSSRDSFAAASLSLGKSFNHYTTEELNTAANLLKNSNYNTWGDDNLKGNVASGNLDIALVYSGDYFDQLWADDFKNNTYDIYIPNVNNVFYDGMCIPTNSKNVDLAYEFINFMIDEDNAIENAGYVGYCPVFQSVFDAIMEDEEMDCVTNKSAWNPQNISPLELDYVYVDLKDTYSEMEELYNKLRVK